MDHKAVAEEIHEHFGMQTCGWDVQAITDILTRHYSGMVSVKWLRGEIEKLLFGEAEHDLERGHNNGLRRVLALLDQAQSCNNKSSSAGKSNREPLPTFEDMRGIFKRETLEQDDGK